MRKFWRPSGEVVATAIIVMILLEVALRLFPGLIPVSILIDFSSGLREQIAQRRRLPTEGIMRLVERDDGGPPLRVYKPYAEITYGFTDPGAVKTVRMDGAGFCNPDDSYVRPEFDIAVMGDSFAWCTTVRPEDTWSSQLADITGRSVYNLGVAGRGVHDYLQLLKSFGLPKSPAIVILNVYEGNDLRDADQFHAYVRRVHSSGGSKSISVPCTLPYPLCIPYRLLKEGPIGRTSYVFNLTATVARNGRDLLAAAAERWAGESEQTSEETNFRYHVRHGVKTAFNADNGDLDEVLYARRLKGGGVSLQLFEDALQSFVELSRRHGFLPVVTYTPSAHSVYRKDVAFEDKTLQELMPWFSETQRDFFETGAIKFGYTFIDLTPALSAAAAGSASEFLYFPTNLHLTDSGHRVIAEVLAKALLSLPRTK